MGVCAAPNCENRARDKKFFPFPTDINRRRTWTLRCQLTSVGGNDRLCEDHFDNNQFQHGQAVKKLRQDAVPTLFLDSSRIFARIEEPASPVAKKVALSNKKLNPLKADILPPLFSDPIRIQTVKKQLQLIEVLTDTPQSKVKQVELKDKNASIEVPTVAPQPKVTQVEPKDNNVTILSSEKPGILVISNGPQPPRKLASFKNLPSWMENATSEPTVAEKEHKNPAKNVIGVVTGTKQSRRKSKKPVKNAAAHRIQTLNDRFESFKVPIKATGTSKQKLKKKLQHNKYPEINAFALTKTPVTKIESESDNSLLKISNICRKKRQAKEKVQNYVEQSASSEFESDNDLGDVNNTQKRKKKSKKVQRFVHGDDRLEQSKICVKEEKLDLADKVKLFKRKSVKHVKYDDYLSSFSESDGTELVSNPETDSADEDSLSSTLKYKQHGFKDMKLKDCQVLLERLDINVVNHALQQKRKSVSLQDKIEKSHLCEKSESDGRIEADERDHISKVEPVKYLNINVNHAPQQKRIPMTLQEKIDRLKKSYSPGKLESDCRIEADERKCISKNSTAKRISLDCIRDVNEIQKQKNILLDNIHSYSRPENKMTFPKEAPMRLLMPKPPVSITKLEEAPMRLLMPKPPVSINKLDKTNTKGIIPRMKQWNKMLKSELVDLGQKYKTEIRKNEVLLESQLQIEMENRKLKQDCDIMKADIVELKKNSNSFIKVIEGLERHAHTLRRMFKNCIKAKGLRSIKKQQKKERKTLEIMNKSEIPNQQIMKLAIENKEEHSKQQVNELEVENNNEQLEQQIMELEIEIYDEPLKQQLVELDTENENDQPNQETMELDMMYKYEPKQQMMELEYENEIGQPMEKLENEQMKQLKIENEYKQMKQQMEEFEIENERKQQMKELKIENEQLKLALRKLETEKKINQLEIENENKQLKQQMDELESENVAMIEENELMLDEIQQYIINNKRMSEKIAEQEKQNSVVNCKLKYIEKDNEAMSKKIMDFEKEFVELKKNNDFTVSESTQVTDIFSKLEEAEKEKVTMSKKIKDFEKEVADLRKVLLFLYQ